MKLGDAILWMLDIKHRAGIHRPVIFLMLVTPAVLLTIAERRMRREEE
ncbi:MAG: hypothetical protein H0W68_13080 [Gemmatimonadaceae bacterium]|nr:hypothetical protein [Gemmatimonadaceae bacterium]